MSEKQLTYTLSDALADLGGVTPDVGELQRLVDNYPTYSKPHRQGLLRGMFENSSLADLVAAKLEAKGLPRGLSKQAKGGHAHWVVSKVQKTVIRLLYLRLRLDKDLTRRQANQQLLKKFSSSIANDGGQSRIRKATRSHVLDG